MAEGDTNNSMKLAVAFVEFTGSTVKFDQAVGNVKKSLTNLKPTFDFIQNTAKATFLAIAGAAAYAANAYGAAEEDDHRLRAALRASYIQAEQNRAAYERLALAMGRLPAVNVGVGDIDGAVDSATDRLSAFAGALQNVTVYGDDFLKSMMATALNLGVLERDLESTTKVAIGVAERLFNGDLRMGIEAVSMAYGGNYRTLQRLIPGLKEASSEQEKWNLVVQQGTLGMGQANEKTRTFHGALTQLWENTGDIAEQFGKELIPALTLTARSLNAVALQIKLLSSEQNRQIVKWAAITAAVSGLVVIGPYVVAALTGIGSAFVAVGALALNSVALLTASIAKGATVAAGAVGFLTGSFVKLAGVVAGALRLGGLFALLTNPITLTIAAVAALGATIAYVVGEGEAGGDRIRDGFVRMGQAAERLPAILERVGDAIRQSMGDAWSSVTATFRTIVGYWRSIAEGFISYFRSAWALVPQIAKDALGGIGSAFSQTFGFIGRQVAQVIGFVANTFADGFGAILDGVVSFAKFIISIADNMFGSFPGFMQGLVTLWNQAGFQMLAVWVRLKTGILNLWEEIKHSGKAVFFVLGGDIAEFARKTMGVFQSLVAGIGRLWDQMIDALASKLAGFLVRRQARIDVETVVSEGQKVDDKLIKQMLVLGLGGEGGIESRRRRLNDQYAGRELTAEDINGMVADVTSQRSAAMDQMEASEKARKQKEHEARLAAIQTETDTAVAGIEEWATAGLDAANKERDGAVAQNNAAKDKDLAATEEARRADLAADLANLSKMPKLSDQFKEVIDAVVAGANFDAVRKMVDDLNKKAGDIFAQSQADVDGVDQYGRGKGQNAIDAMPSRSIKDVFEENLKRQVVGASLIQQEEQRRKREAEDLRKQEASDRRKAIEEAGKNTGATADNTSAVNRLTSLLADGIPATYA